MQKRMTIPLAVLAAFLLVAGCASGKAPAAVGTPGTEGAPAAVAPASTEPSKPAGEASKSVEKDAKAAPAPADAAGSVREDDVTSDTYAFMEPETGPGAATATDGARSAPVSGSTAGTARSPAASAAKTPPVASGLRAGFSDDNAQYNYFVHFLEEFAKVRHHDLPIGERITLVVRDANGKPVSGARVTVSLRGRTLDSGRSYSNGYYRIYPDAWGQDAKAAAFDVRVEAQAGKSAAVQASVASLIVQREGPRTVELKLDKPRSVAEPLPVDILFVMDTTGSMGEEIERLRSTIEIIYANIGTMKPKPAVRFGLVLYRDVEDEYVTKVVDFTSDLDAFQRILDGVDADGGGDTPEDLQSALDDAIHNVSWNGDGIKLAFVVTDADAQLDYAGKYNFTYGGGVRLAQPVTKSKPWKGREYTYADAARDAKAMAVKIYTIGTGGLPIEGEYLLRQLAQYTDARYIFLTYGEAGEAQGGREGSVSHHTGTNFTTDKLEAVVMRFVKEEMAFQSDTPLETGEDYFDAKKVEDENREKTLELLFTDALKNLVDYSTYRIGPDTPCAVLPVTTSDQTIATTAEYFGERVLLTASGAKLWKIVDRKNLQAIADEIELQLSGLFDESQAAKVGELLGAEILVVGNVYKRGGTYELFLKLVRVQTAEVLAVSRAKIDEKLGL
ncbi:MAG: VWA domain-containing protein [Spirochaetes bacterium]|nr:VWA domain-containing protein [Spirochaetota bacterium]